MTQTRRNTQTDMLFLYPPAAKISEPPAGIARLAGALRHHGITTKSVDMSLEGFTYLFEKEVTAEDRWSTRAIHRKAHNLDLLTTSAGYGNIDRYRNAVLDTNRVLKVASEGYSAIASIANYKSDALSSVKSADLMEAANTPEANVYFPYFKSRLKELETECGGLTTVGLSMNYLNQALSTFALIGHLKASYPHVRIVLGGGLVTSWMRMPEWENPFTGLVDHMIPGEGEHALLSLFHVEPDRKHYLPDYDDFKDLPYLSPGFILPFCAAGGCWWRKCTFCPERAEKNPYTPVQTDTAVEQLCTLVETLKPTLVHIVDNSVGPAFLRKLFASGFNTPWYAFARVTPHLTDENFCRALKASGCRMLKLGIESGDADVLTEMNKGVELSLVSRALEALHRVGIQTYVYLLFGTPSETEAAARKTMDFVVTHHEKIGFLNLSVFNLPYFAPEAKTLDTSSFYDGDLTLYSEFKHPLGWNRSLIRHFLEKEFKKHPLIAPIVHGDPPVFNSNHAAFFQINAS
ncbi:radical SAM protein [Desulfoluna sp.]|uniref:B12-binding domain-containing radical SAM protein n=1 Tax=Desulfoluna sp. TaxID=2045199 RepID=UPI00260D3CB0|nr:radical SAM protein [Desulfoluna sp.]